MRWDENVAEVRQLLAASPAKVFAAFAEASLVSRWGVVDQLIELVRNALETSHRRSPLEGRVE